MLLKQCRLFVRLPLTSLYYSSKFTGPKPPQSIFTDPSSHRSDQEYIKQAYRELAQEIEAGNDESVLSLLNGKRKVEKREITPAEEKNMEMSKYYREMSKSLSTYLANLTPEEHLLRTRQLQQSQMNKRDWSINEGVNIDYQDYSIFDKTLLQIKKTTAEPERKNNKLFDFLSNLDPDVAARKETEDYYSFFNRDPAGLVKGTHRGLYGLGKKKKPRKEMALYYKHKAAQNNDKTLDFSERQLAWNNRAALIKNPYRCESDQEEYKPRLSFKARQEIFDLHNQGWSVRDLSVRFGAIPPRIKAIIYQMKYYFAEIFPNLSLKEFTNYLSLELEYEKIHPVVDYGIDMKAFSDLHQGQLRTIFKHHERDIDVAKLDPREQAKLRKLFLKKKTKKYDIVTEKYVGQPNKGYFIKSWLMYKTKSKPRVDPIFARILKDSEHPYKLPVNAQKRLHLGPRMASSGFGFR